ncbi:hypothetical protein D3C75_368150 [compost metagenome]
MIFLGRLEKEFTLLGKKWTLSTLSSDEQVAATAATGDLETISRINALKIHFLARSIKKIDNEEIIDFNEGYELVSQLQFPVVNALYTRYQELQEEQDEALKNLDEIKN